MKDSEKVPPVLIPVPPIHGAHSQPRRGSGSALDRQSVFDRVKDHLVSQGRPSVNQTGNCVYRSTEGLKCGIGALIADENFDPEFNEARLPEGCVLSMLRCSGIVIDLNWEEMPEGGDDLDFLLRLQAAHDENPVQPNWSHEVEKSLRKVADDFKLLFR